MSRPRSIHYGATTLTVLFLLVAPSTADLLGEHGIQEGVDCGNVTSCDAMHPDHWDRPTCVIKIKGRQRTELDFWTRFNNTDYFMSLGDDGLANTDDQMIVTMRGCHEFCGKPTFYWDAIPRVTTWLIPVVLLLCNIELSPIDKRRFMTLIHAIGDPIDSFWSLLHKLFVWRRLYAIALDRCLRQDGEGSVWTPREIWKRRLQGLSQRFSSAMNTWRRGLQRFRVWVQGRLVNGANESQTEEEFNSAEQLMEEEWNSARDRAQVIATVLAGFEEIGGAETKSELHYMMIMDELGIVRSGPQPQEVWKEWRYCARVLADSRTNEFLRTLLAIFIYMYTVIAALYAEVGGGNSSAPGGRIGSAVFLLWLVPLALISNTIGTFTSRRTCLTIMQRFVKSAKAVMETERQDQGWSGQGVFPEAVTPQSPRQRQPSGEPAPDSPFPETPSARGSDVSVKSDQPLLGPVPLTPPSPARKRNAEIKSTSSKFSPQVVQSPSGERKKPMTPGSLLGVDSTATHRRTASLGSLEHPRTSRRRSGSVHFPKHIIAETLEPPTIIAGYREETQNRRPSTSSSRGRGSAQLRSKASLDNALRHAVYQDSPEITRTEPSGDLGNVEIGSPFSMIDNEPDSPRVVPSRRSGLHSPNWGGIQPGQATHEREIQQPDETPREHKVTLVPEIPWSQYFSGLQPLGAIYTYRPWKLEYRSVSIKTHAHYTSNWYLFFLSVWPIFVSSFGASLIMWYAVPIGWSCRNVWILGVTVIWLGSVGITTWLHSRKPLGMLGQRLWLVILVKDTVVGFGSLLIIFLSTSGLFNNCYCWSSFMWHRFLRGDWGTKAFVELSTTEAYTKNGRVIYSPIVFGCFVAHMAFFMFVVFLWWEGIYVARWNEERCHRDWRHEVANGQSHISHDQSTELLFWYDERKYHFQEATRERRNSEYAMVRHRSRSNSATFRFRRGSLRAENPDTPLSPMGSPRIIEEEERET